MKIKLLIAVAALSTLASCKKDEEPQGEAKLNTVPEFFVEAEAGSYGNTAPDFRMIADIGDRVIQPQDLDFHSQIDNQLWVINRGNDAQGGTSVTIFNPGKDDQKTEFRKDQNSWHFMAFPSGIAFSPNLNTWATTANILDANRRGGSFTGPSLWSGDLNVYAMPSGGNGSHLDMLHGSPYSMGIAAEKDNVFWVYDGYNEHLVRYDFVADHGPGNDDHSDARVFRYTDVTLKREGTYPHHMVLDDNSKWLYIADGPGKRIIRVDITTGAKVRDMQLINELLAEHAEYKGATVEVVLDKNLDKPCGIEIVGNRLFVTDNANGDIIAINTESKTEIGRVKTGSAGITGIVFGQGKLWYANQTTNGIYVVEPK